MNIKDLYNKYKDIILYGFFGVCTTAVNVVTYWLMAHIFSVSTMPSTLVAWVVAVLFAYVTNRKWVFRSEAKGKSEIIKEIISFFSCRIATGVVDWACMYIFVDLLKLNDVIIKIIANFIVIVLNYIASKLIIFKKKSDKKVEKKKLQKLDKKSKVIFSLLIILIIGFTGFNLYKSQSRLTYIEYKSLNEKSQNYISIKNTGDELVQEFKSPYNLINGIKIKIGTHKRDNNSKWKLILQEKKTKKEIYNISFNGSLLEDNEFNFIEFDKNIKVNKNDIYEIKIVADSVSENTALAFFKSTGKAGKNKTLEYNGEKVSGTLCAQIYGGTKDLWWSAFELVLGLFLLSIVFRAIYVIKMGNKLVEDNLLLSMIVGGIVFYLLKFFAIDSTFTDEFDNIRGGMIISKGGVLYKDYITQHTPFVYYLCSIFAFFRAASVEQFRLFYYMFLGFCFGFLYFRHSKNFGKKKMFLLPIIECILITSIIHPRGHQILSDGVQGLCMIALLLEFIQYLKDKKIDWKRCVIISLAVWGSIGSAFISAYSIIWVVISVIIMEVIYWINKQFSIKKLISRYYKLLLAMIIPLAGAVLYFYLNGALVDAFEQFYLFNREVYSNYTGIGANLFQPFVDSVKYFFNFFAEKFNLIFSATASNIDLLQLVVLSISSIIICLLMKKKKYIESITLFMAMICSASRGYDFHSLPAWYIAILISVLYFDVIRDYIPKKSLPLLIIISMLLSSTYIVKLSENILYKQTPITKIENYVINNTKENEKIMMDAYSCDTIYFLYKNRYPVNRTVYMLPWYMDWYEEDAINELIENKPKLVIFNEKRKTWGYTKYANAYLNVLKENYEKVSDGEEDDWKSYIWKLKKEEKESNNKKTNKK